VWRRLFKNLVSLLKKSGVASSRMTAFLAADARSDKFLYFAVSHETRFFVMKISLYRQFLITGFF
jgi:hypothetical protein